MAQRIHAIFVPQGAEFSAVQRGLRRCHGVRLPALYAIPMGPQPLATFLTQWLHESVLNTEGEVPVVLLVGLCGSLTSTLKVGDRVVYRSCIDARSPVSVPPRNYAIALLPTLQERLGDSVMSVTGVMCDRLVHLARDKATLAQRYGAQVVDMEGYVFLEALQPLGFDIGMVRVVSDNAQGDVPDLAAAMTPSGSLDPWQLGLQMVRQPRRAFRLIQGSLLGLKQLEQTMITLFGIQS